MGFWSWITPVVVAFGINKKQANRAGKKLDKKSNNAMDGMEAWLEKAGYNTYHQVIIPGLGVLHILSSPKRIAKFELYIAVDKPSGSDILTILDKMGKYEVSHPACLMALALNVFLMVMPEDMIVAEAMGEVTSVIAEDGTEYLLEDVTNLGVTDENEIVQGTNVVDNDGMSGFKYTVKKQFEMGVFDNLEIEYTRVRWNYSSEQLEEMEAANLKEIEKEEALAVANATPEEKAAAELEIRRLLNENTLIDDYNDAPWRDSK